MVIFFFNSHVKHYLQNKTTLMLVFKLSFKYIQFVSSLVPFSFMFFFSTLYHHFFSIQNPRKRNCIYKNKRTFLIIFTQTIEYCRIDEDFAICSWVLLNLGRSFCFLVKIEIGRAHV